MENRPKPRKIETHYDKYFNVVTYEYRGQTYDVTYASGFSLCVTPARIQHQDAQDRIDNLLDNPQPELDDDIMETLDYFYNDYGRGKNE